MSGAVLAAEGASIWLGYPPVKHVSIDQFGGEKFRSIAGIPCLPGSPYQLGV